MPVESGITALAQRVGLEIKTLKAASIVADVVACYDNTSTGHAGTETDILHYDVTGLTDKDIVLVLKDEEHDNQKSYYRYDAAGTNLAFEIAEDKVDHPIATLTTFGAVKPDGSTISISDGVISYTLPTATATRLGGVKIAADGGLQITTAGVLSVKASALPVATTSTLGAVKVDGTTITVASDGTISAVGGTVDATTLPVASYDSVGVISVKTNAGLFVSDAGKLATTPATTSNLGTVMVGTGLSVTDDGVLSVDLTAASQALSSTPATYSTLGTVIVGNGLAVDSTGVLSVDLSKEDVLSSMPIATTTSLGGVKISTATGLTISSDGTLGLNLGAVDDASTILPIATTAKVGVVKPDDSTIKIDSDGTIYADTSTVASSLPIATTSSVGVIKLNAYESGMKIASDGTIYLQTKYPLSVDSLTNSLELIGYTEEEWELTMEDGSTVKRTFLTKTTS